jgi:hypothetical protein
MGPFRFFFVRGNSYILLWRTLSLLAAWSPRDVGYRPHTRHPFLLCDKKGCKETHPMPSPDCVRCLPFHGGSPRSQNSGYALRQLFAFFGEPPLHSSDGKGGTNTEALIVTGEIGEMEGRPMWQFSGALVMPSPGEIKRFLREAADQDLGR